MNMWHMWYENDRCGSICEVVLIEDCILAMLRLHRDDLL